MEPLKILVCSDSFYPPRGGGDISMRYMCRSLSSRGHSISCCYIGTERDPDFESHPKAIASVFHGLWPRIWSIEPAWREHLRSVLRQSPPDLVMAQQTVTTSTLEVCGQLRIPVVVFLQSVDLFCLGSFWSGHPWKCKYRCAGCKDAGPRFVQFPFFIRQLRRARRLLPEANAVVSNSEFMRRTLHDLWGLESTVITPMIRPFTIERSASKPREILMFSPHDYKGVATATSVAGKMRDQRFLFVGNCKNRIRKRIEGLGNAELMPWVSDASLAYRRAKILIVPSIIPEGFGMVCVEAMSQGIPCIVSGVGALPETVGSGGDFVIPHTDVDKWVDTISKYGSSEYLSERSSNAISESQRYLTADIAGKVETLLKDVIASTRH